MTTQLAERPPTTRPGPPAYRPRLSWRSVGHDLAYLVPGFFLTLLGFVVLLPLFVLGVGTLVLWVGAPILGFMLLAATGFARENRELARRWGADVPEPAYRQPRADGVRRLITTAADPQAWKEALHGILVAFPLRLVTFVLSVTWVTAGLGGITYFVWGVFLPDSDGGGLGWLLTRAADLELDASWYVIESVTNFVAGVLLLLLAPLVVRLCCVVDTAVVRVFLSDRLLAAPHGR